MLPECNRVSNVSILGRVNSVSVVRFVSQAYRDLEEEIHQRKKIIVRIINGGERPGETLVLTTVDYGSVDLCVAKFLEGRQYPLADVDSA